jgi:hypothetical protein
MVRAFSSDLRLQDGTKLTGTVTGPQGDPIDISKGKVDGDKVSFVVAFNGMTINHDGVISGDEIKLKTKSDQADFPADDKTLTQSIQVTRGGSGSAWRRRRGLVPLRIGEGFFRSRSCQLSAFLFTPVRPSGRPT